MANPFLVLGGIAVGIVVAGFGILQVPGWIQSAQDAAAQNDLANASIAQAATASRTGFAVADLDELKKSEGTEFQTSGTVADLITDANGSEYGVIAISASERAFGRVNSGEIYSEPNRGALLANPDFACAWTTAGLKDIGLTAPGCSSEEPSDNAYLHRYVEMGFNYHLGGINDEYTGRLTIQDFGSMARVLSSDIDGVIYLDDSKWFASVDEVFDAISSNSLFVSAWEAKFGRLDLTEGLEGWAGAPEWGGYLSGDSVQMRLETQRDVVRYINDTRFHGNFDSDPGMSWLTNDAGITSRTSAGGESAISARVDASGLPFIAVGSLKTGFQVFTAADRSSLAKDAGMLRALETAGIAPWW